MARNPWKQISEIDDYEKMKTKKKQWEKGLLENLRQAFEGLSPQGGIGSSRGGSYGHDRGRFGTRRKLSALWLTKLEPHKWRPKEAKQGWYNRIII